jgi:signal transduction histidine kinase
MRFEKGFELTVYRVVQELVNNALKHSAAGEIVVELIQEPERLSLNVRDNGKGFDPGISYFSGHGLSNIRSRIGSYSGLFDISSREGLGSEAMISFNDTKPYVRNN